MKYSDCEYLSETNHCLVASEMVGFQVLVLDDKACKVCQKQKNPKAPNMVTASLAISNAIRFRPELREIVLDKLKDYVIRKTDGPGSELTILLKEYGYEPAAGCKCFEMMEEMNKNGYDWCLANRQKIADVMIQEWQNRHWILAKIIPSKLLKNDINGAMALINQALAKWYEKVSVKK